MEHKIVTSRRSGERWKIKCSCGWFATGDRWAVEEWHRDHATPTPQIEDRLLHRLTAHEPETTQGEWSALAPLRDRFL